MHTIHCILRGSLTAELTSAQNSFRIFAKGKIPAIEFFTLLMGNTLKKEGFNLERYGELQVSLNVENWAAVNWNVL